MEPSRIEQHDEKINCNTRKQLSSHREGTEEIVVLATKAVFRYPVQHIISLDLAIK